MIFKLGNRYGPLLSIDAKNKQTNKAKQKQTKQNKTNNKNKQTNKLTSSSSFHGRHIDVLMTSESQKSGFYGVSLKTEVRPKFDGKSLQDMLIPNTKSRSSCQSGSKNFTVLISQHQ